jgi:hypothetical protein
MRATKRPSGRLNNKVRTNIRTEVAIPSDNLLSINPKLIKILPEISIPNIEGTFNWKCPQ